MAEKYYTAASGNWSTAANWNGGTVPGTGDDVYANNKAITLDQDITVLSIRSTSGTTAVAGGTFTCNASRTINANVIGNNNGIACLQDGGVSGTITVNGNLSGGNAAIATTSTWVINGSLTGGNTTSQYCFSHRSGTCPSVTINGNITGGSAGSTQGWYNDATVTTLSVTGNVSNSASSPGMQITASGTYTITGDIVGTATASQWALLTVSTSVVTVTGNCTGCSIRHQSTGTLTINGNATGPSSGTAYGIRCDTANSSLVMNGDATAGTVMSCIGITSVSASVTVNGQLIGNSRGIGSTDSLVWALDNTVIQTSGVVKARTIKCGPNGAWPVNGPCFITNIHQGSVKVKNSLLNEGVYELSRTVKGTTMGGDYQVGDVIYLHARFKTAPTSLSVAAYPDDSTAEITTGITPTYASGFDGRDGLVSVKIDTTSGYTAGKDYTLVATAGTVFGDSIVGEVLGCFSLAKQSLSSASGIRSAVGLASANLDTQLSTIAGYVDTEVTAAGIRGALGLASANLDTQLSTIAGYVDTETSAASIRAALGLASANLDTQLNTIAGYTDTVESTLSTIAGYTDSVEGTLSTLSTAVATVSGYTDTVEGSLALIKAKTDNLPADTSAAIAGVPASVWNFDLLANIATSVNRYSPWNAMRHIINKWSISGTTKSVYKEDGTTVAYTTTVTSDATGITGDTP